MPSGKLESDRARTPYIFDIKKFAHAVRSARSIAEMTQGELAERASLQINTIRQVEASATDCGIMTALSIAHALEFEVPSVRIDKEVVKFACDLFLEPSTAAAKFDELFEQLAVMNQPRGFQPPRNLLWLTALKARKNFLFSVTIKELEPLRAGRRWEQCWEDVLPVELALYLESKVSKSKQATDRGREAVYAKPALFWKHIVTGRSDNVGISRLGAEMWLAQAAFEDAGNDSGIGDSLYDLALRAFNNHFKLKIAMRKAAAEAKAELTDDYMVYLASFLRLYKSAKLQRFRQGQEGLRAAVEGISGASA